MRIELIKNFIHNFRFSYEKCLHFEVKKQTDEI